MDQPQQTEKAFMQQHHHHHLMPPQHAQRLHQSDHVVNAAGPSNQYQAPRPVGGSRSQNSSGSSSTCLSPSWTGFIHTTHDALMVLEACLLGRISHIPRRPHDRERQQIIAGGNVFVYEENASGIKRWTDGVTWSPSRIMGNFLVYRELSEPFPAGEKKKAKKRKRVGTEENERVAAQALYTEEDRKLVGSLVDSYGFKPSGLIKKTLNVKYQGVNHHIISYYNLEDVKSGVYKRPKHSPVFNDLTPRPELVQNGGFKVSALDPEEDHLALVDPFMNGLPQSMSPSIAGSSMYGNPNPRAVQVFTQHPQMQAQDQMFSQMQGLGQGYAMSPSPLSTSTNTTRTDYYGIPHTPQYMLPTNFADGPHSGPSRDGRMDSVIAPQHAQYKTEISELSDPSLLDSMDNRTTINAPMGHCMSYRNDMFAVQQSMAQSHYPSLVDGHSNWQSPANKLHDPSTMPRSLKRRQTAPISTMGGLGYALQPQMQPNPEFEQQMQPNSDYEQQLGYDYQTTQSNGSDSSQYR